VFALRVFQPRVFQQSPGPVYRAVAASAALAAVTGTAAAASHVAPASGVGPDKISAASAFHRIILPDLLVVSPAGISRQQTARLAQVKTVRNMIVFDGAEINIGGQPASVVGVNPAQFRSWVPLHTASDQPLWTALSKGGFVAAQSARTSLGLRHGRTYQLTGATSQQIKFGGAANLNIAGIDLVVNTATSRRLGLVHQVATLISAPGADLPTLTGKVRKILGSGATIESLRQQQLPVSKVAPGQVPSSYLQLFKASAAQYCPGLSWTVLAAIGQIESGDGANVGPSSAGALGPMQFEPATWKVWGTDGFGRTGPPDIMDPYDAVPSAARMLCADGAAHGGTGLRQAIFDYNHATWYVNEVLGLAARYAAD
jgi:hypothetical protein